MKVVYTAMMAAAALGATTATPVMAQNYPAAPIHVTVPFPAGALDIFPRFLQPGIEKELGQPLVIEIKPGANGAIGAEFVARSAPDGYNILFTSNSGMNMGPLVAPEVRWDAERDFVPVAGVVGGSWVLIVRKGLPVNNLDEFVAYVKANPGKVNFGTSGPGSIAQVLGETMTRAIGARMNLVHYRGFPPLLQGVSGGEVDATVMSPGFARPLLAKGDAKLLGFDGVPLPTDFPVVPDLTKAIPGFETLGSWAGFYAPAKTPKPVVDRLNKAIQVAATPPDVRAKLLTGGERILVGTPEEFATLNAQDLAASKRLVGALKAAGVKFD